MVPNPEVTLYGFITSPPLRGSMTSCEALGVRYKLKTVDVAKLENHTPEYVKLNPLRKIPTMVDGDYVLFDSHAISCYLANAYSKDDKWYPKDPRQRGIVDQRLHFDGSVLGSAFMKMAVPLLFGKKPHPRAVAQVEDAVQALDKLLGDSEFIALSWPTIADCHCSSTALSIEVMMPNAITPRVSSWLRRCERSLPGYEKVHGPAKAVMQKNAISGIATSKLQTLSKL